MSKTVMMTLPRNRESIEEVYLLQFMIDNDIHKWIIAKETGNDGYKHWQVRLNWRGTFEELKAKFPKAHIEDASDNFNYERKEGNFITSEDSVDVLRTRNAELRSNQRAILDNIGNQSDREIDVIVDRRGNTGKSFLARYLYERGIGFYVPPTISNTQAIIQFIASGYENEPIIVIDIPRSTKWTTALYICIETIKDGLVYDARYSTKVRDIFGVKVLVFTNTVPNLSKLSNDRWRLFGHEGAPIS